MKEICKQCGYVHDEINARKIWRKHGWGRLYYRLRNRHWNNGWIYPYLYCAKLGTVSVYFRDAGDVIHEALGIE